MAAEGAGQQSDIAGKLGIEPGMVVQELGYDADVDQSIREAVEDQTGEELLDQDAQDVIDVVLLWFRDGDGDLVDNLVDARTPLAENGVGLGADAEDRPRRSPGAVRDRGGGRRRRGCPRRRTRSVGDDWGRPAGLAQVGQGQ